MPVSGLRSWIDDRVEEGNRRLHEGIASGARAGAAATSRLRDASRSSNDHNRLARDIVTDPRFYLHPGLVAGARSAGDVAGRIGSPSASAEPEGLSLPPPTPQRSQGGGSGGASGGGRDIAGMIGDAKGHIAGGGGDPYADFSSALQQYRDATAQIDAAYEQQLEELRGYYEFAETAEERAAIQFILADIEGQREAGHQIVEGVYNDAIEDAGARASAMQATAEDEAEAIQGMFRDAGERARAGTVEVADDATGSGVGVGLSPVQGDADAWQAQIEAAAPVEGAYAQRTGRIASEDAEWMGDLLGTEQGAQQGELQRVAMQLGAAAQADHDRRVQERIAAERMAFADQAGRLGSQRLDARQAAAMGEVDLALQLAQMQNEDRREAERWQRDRNAALEDRRLDWDMDREAQRLMQEQEQEQMASSDPRTLTPAQQMDWVGEMNAGGMGQTVAAWHRAGAIDPAVAEFYQLDDMAGMQ